MNIDWTITVEGLVTGSGMLVTAASMILLMRKDIKEMKALLNAMQTVLNSIPIILGRHDERLKALEHRQEERIRHERNYFNKD